MAEKKKASQYDRERKLGRGGDDYGITLSEFYKARGYDPDEKQYEK